MKVIIESFDFTIIANGKYCGTLTVEKIPDNVSMNDFMLGNGDGDADIIGITADGSEEIKGCIEDFEWHYEAAKIKR